MGQNTILFTGRYFYHKKLFSKLEEFQ